MSDLLTAIFIQILLCAGLFHLGTRLSEHRGSARFGLSVAVAVAGMAIYGGLLWNRPVMASILPGSGLIVLANWLPLWGCFFAGIYSQSTKVSRSRRSVLGAACLVACLYSTIQPVTGTAAVCGHGMMTPAGLQYQSTPFTCSAACAVSLLNMHGIDATESELADLCLTRQGTHWMGLYRGLKVKTANTAWDVEVTEFDPHRFASPVFDSPGILALDIDSSVFPEDVDHGFQSDVGHSVVFLQKQSDEVITVFDPSPDFGVEDWGTDVLRCVRGGVVLRLVPRNERIAWSPVHRRVASALLERGATAGL